MSRAISVLHVVDSFSNQAGSVAISLDGMFRELRRLGVSSTVVTSDPIPRRSDHAALHSHDSKDLVRYVDAADLVHFHGFSKELADQVFTTVRRAGKRYLISTLGSFSPNEYEQGGWLTRWMDRIRSRRVLGKSAVIISLNEGEAKDIRPGWPTSFGGGGADDRPGAHTLAYHRLPHVQRTWAIRRRLRHAGRVRLLPYGLSFRDYEGDTGAVGELNVDGDARVLLFLGPIHPIEGLVPLIRSVGELGHDFRGWKLVLAGPQPGPWRQKLEAAVARKGAQDRVIFLADPDLATQRALLSRASVLVSPSLSVRCPISVMQAVASGVPVVAADHGLPRGLTSTVTVCKPTRADLRDALRPLISANESDRVAIGLQARRDWAGVVDWTVLIRKFVDLYEGVIST